MFRDEINTKSCYSLVCSFQQTHFRTVCCLQGLRQWEFWWCQVMRGRGCFLEYGALLKKSWRPCAQHQLRGVLGEGRSEGNNRDEARCHIPPGPILDDPNYQCKTKRKNFKDDVYYMTKVIGFGIRRYELWVCSLLLVYYMDNLGSLCLSFSTCKMGHDGDDYDDDDDMIYNFSEGGSKNQLRQWRLDDFDSYKLLMLLSRLH